VAAPLELLSTGEIAAHLAEIYGTSVSCELISKVIDKVFDELADRQNRPLDAVYPELFVDADPCEDLVRPAVNLPKQSNPSTHGRAGVSRVSRLASTPP